MKEKLPLLKRASIMLLFVITSTNLFAQTPIANTGKSFFVAFGKNDNNVSIDSAYNSSLKKFIYNVELILRFTATAPANLFLHFTESPYLNDTITVSSGEVRDYKLSFAQSQAVYSGKAPSPSGTRNFKSLQITATNPVSMVAMSSAYHSVEATLVFPVTKLGMEHVHIGMTCADNTHINGYLVVATEDNTTITQTGPVGFPYQTPMNKGEVYFYPYNATSGTPTSTRIVTDKPVAFFQNGSRSTAANRENFTFEQIPPVNQWGTKFIVPSSYNVLNGQYSCFARIYPKDNKSTDIVTGTITYSDGKIETFTIDQPGVAYRYKDVSINATNNWNATAFYIATDKPVSVCAYNAPRLQVTNDVAQPGTAWIPPLEQKTRNVLVSPLDFNGNHVFLSMHHYFTVITPTAGRENTTISVNDAPVQPISQQLSKFSWMGTVNAGGTSYSVGRYYFGESNVALPTPLYLNTKVLVDNPNGIILFAYGQGSYTNYFYTAGAGSRKLDMPYAQVCGTVFPVVHYGVPEYDNLFPVTASLYDISLQSQGPEAILAAVPLHTTTAVYYDGTEFVPNTPKYPGYLGCTNNPGLTINWEALNITPGEKNNTPIVAGELPETPVGLYKIEDVPMGEYILVLSKEGYFPRFAKVNLNTEEILLEHRELIPGYVNGNAVVDEPTIGIVLSKISQYGKPLYSPKYDIDEDLQIDMTDITILKVYLGFHFGLYEDTKQCFPGLR